MLLSFEVHYIHCVMSATVIHINFTDNLPVRVLVTCSINSLTANSGKVMIMWAYKFLEVSICIVTASTLF